jgi:hypothetical protein
MSISVCAAGAFVISTFMAASVAGLDAAPAIDIGTENSAP